MSDNIRFLEILTAAWFSDGEKHDLRIIFWSMSPDRQTSIIDHWPEYLIKITSIKDKAHEERQKIILEAKTKLHSLLDDLTIRKFVQEKRGEEKEQETKETRLGAEKFDNIKLLEKMKKIGQSNQKDDPLAFL